ncbi:MAG: protein kinase [Planctomycetales bacterium]|nr:protein kinase [Planctomycetales bacterium]
MIEAAIGNEQWWGDARRSLVGGVQRRDREEHELSLDAESTSTKQLLDLLGPTDDPAMLGRIGSYEIVGILGRGGMGAVFKGFDGALNRFVAIKVLLPHLATSGAARKRFAREAQAAAAVVDDHVMAIHAVNEWNSTPYFVMPYSRGVSLQKRLSGNGPLEVRETLRIGMQAARGLAAAHAQGLVHRDIKPANIFLDEGVERVQLMDFGLARAVDDASLTQSGVLAGTPQYMSPEQARAETVDARSDLFSLGAVLYAMCTGHAPFRAESSHAVLRLITDRQPRPIREINPDIPEWLCAIIDRLMSKQAADRYESAAQVAMLLESCLAHVQEPTRVSLPRELTSFNSQLSRRFVTSWKGVLPMLGAIGTVMLGTILISVTNPPDISGRWQGDGDGWGEVVLEPTDVKGKSFAGTFSAPDSTTSGKLTLKWSRIEHRFNGTWVDDNDGSGKLSLCLDGDDLRGAVTVNKSDNAKASRPRLADLHWQRIPIGIDISGPTLDGQGRLVVQPKDLADDSPNVSGADTELITIDLYCGSDVLLQMNVAPPNPIAKKHIKLLTDLQGIEGVNVNFRATGSGQDIQMAIVHDPSQGRGRESATTGKPSTVETAIRSAMTAAGVSSVRWEASAAEARVASKPVAIAERSLYDRLQGTWVITKAIDDGVDAMDEFDDRAGTIVVEGKLLTVHGKNRGRKLELGMLLEFVESGSPQPVDVLIDPNDTESPCRVPGIIECDGSRLKFCLRNDCNAGVENRPKVFSGGQNIWLYECGRVTASTSERGRNQGLLNSSSQTLELLDWATRERGGGGAAATYSLETSTGHQLFKKRNLSAGFTGSVLFSEVPSHQGVTFKARLFLPQLSPRGTDFASRNSIHMNVTTEQLSTVAQGQRIVRAYYYPDDATDAGESQLKVADLFDEQSQANWLASIEKLGQVMVVMELTQPSDEEEFLHESVPSVFGADAERNTYPQRWQTQADVETEPFTIESNHQISSDVEPPVSGKVQGRWKLRRAEEQGMTFTAEQILSGEIPNDSTESKVTIERLQDYHYTIIQNDTISFGPDLLQPKVQGILKVVSNTNPYQITIQLEGEARKGLLDFGGGIITLAIAGFGEEYPTAFNTNGNGVLVLHLSRDEHDPEQLREHARGSRILAKELRLQGKDNKGMQRTATDLLFMADSFEEEATYREQDLNLRRQAFARRSAGDEQAARQLEQEAFEATVAADLLATDRENELQQRELHRQFFEDVHNRKIRCLVLWGDGKLQEARWLADETVRMLKSQIMVQEALQQNAGWNPDSEYLLEMQNRYRDLQTTFIEAFGEGWQTAAKPTGHQPDDP